MDRMIVQMTIGELTYLVKQAVKEAMQAKDFKVLNFDQVREILDVSKPTLYSYVNSNKIKHHRTERKLYFFEKDVLDFIQKNSTTENQ